MIRINKEITGDKKNSLKMLLQIHDELIFEENSKETKKSTKLIKDLMFQSMTLKREEMVLKNLRKLIGSLTYILLQKNLTV